MIDMSKKLVAYFYASGVAAKVAVSLSKASGADIYAIEHNINERENQEFE